MMRAHRDGNGKPIVKFTRETPTPVTVRSVDADAIRVADRAFAHSVALSTAGIVSTWQPRPLAAVTADDLLSLADPRPEVIILGTGEAHVLPPRELVFAMARSGIGFEVMQTAAAARTFNVLVGEGRAVAALLFLHSRD